MAPDSSTLASRNGRSHRHWRAQDQRFVPTRRNPTAAASSPEERASARTSPHRTARPNSSTEQRASAGHDQHRSVMSLLSPEDQLRGMRASWRLCATSRPVASHTSPSSSRNPPVTNRVLKTQRSQPGAGRPRTWAVSSTVGVQATGRRALKAVGGKESTARRRPSVSIDSLVQAEPPAHPRLAARRAQPEAGIVRVQAQVDPPHERGREALSGMQDDAVLGWRQLGWRGVEPLGPGRSRQVTEGPEHASSRRPEQEPMAVVNVRPP